MTTLGDDIGLRDISIEARAPARGLAGNRGPRARPGQRAVRPRRVSNFRVAMLVVFALALGVRFSAAMLIPDGKNCDGCSAGILITNHVGGDGVFYLLAGQALADGRGFVNPYATADIPYAQQPPLWTIVVGGTDVVGLKSVPAKKALFALVGSLTVVLIGLAGRRIVSERVGIRAAVIAAVYPGFWLYERNLNAETIVFPLIVLVILCAYRYRERPGWSRALALGMTVGVLILSRSEQALIVFLLVVPLVLFARSIPPKKRVGHLAIAGVTIAVVLAPWTIYNLGRFEHPVLLSTGLGYTAKAGACDSTFYGSRLGSFDETKCLYGDGSIAAGLLTTADASVADESLRQSARRYTTAHLGRLPIVVLAREDRTWGIVPPRLQLSMNTQLLNAPDSVLWFQLVFYWFLLIAAIVGAIVFRRQRRPLYVLLAFPATVIFSTATTFGDSRYRAPAEVTIVLLAAFALSYARRPQRPTAPPKRSQIPRIT